MITRQVEELISLYMEISEHDYTNKECVLNRIRTLNKSYIEQRSVMHQICLDINSYSCGKHIKIINKIQLQIEVLSESIKSMENIVDFTNSEESE